MNNESSKTHTVAYVKKYLGEGWLLIVSSMLALFFSDKIFIILDKYKTHESINFILSHKDKVILILVTALATGIAISYAAKRLKSFWQDSINPMISSELETLRKAFSASHSENFEKAVSNMTCEALDSKTHSVLSRVYGSHCNNPDSFSQFILSKLGVYFHQASPHRSNYKRKITLVRCKEDPTRFLWHEVCSHKIHCISNGPNKNDQYIKEIKNPNKVPLTYNSKAIVGALNNPKDLDEHRVEVKANSTVKFNSEEELTLQEGKLFSSNKFATAEYDAGTRELTICYEEMLVLDREWTDVEITEHSILAEEDTNLFVRSKLPICRAEIDFTLPEGWVFSDVWFADDDQWRKNHSLPNRLIATTEEWLIPGTIFHCGWRKTN